MFTNTRVVNWLLSHPLQGSPTLIKANKVSLIGDRGILPLAEIIGIDLAKGLCAKSNGEKGFLRRS
jgi:hypothetical protein